MLTQSPCIEKHISLVTYTVVIKLDMRHEHIVRSDMLHRQLDLTTFVFHFSVRCLSLKSFY